MPKINKNSTLLIDVDGVLLLEENPIEGAAETIDFLNGKRINYLIVTNFTRLSKRFLFERFKNAGLNIPENRIFTPVVAAIDFINSKKKNAKCYLIGPELLADEFRESGIGITREEQAVDFVVLGFDAETNYVMLDKAFRLIKAGTPFIALHEYRQHPSKDKMVLSLGCFVKGLEYCTKKEAMVIGKPNKNFFELALKMASAKKENALMVGDSLEGDIIAAQDAGLKVVLVKTGCYDEEELRKSKRKPDYLVESVKELPGLFGL